MRVRVFLSNLFNILIGFDCSQQNRINDILELLPKIVKHPLSGGLMSRSLICSCEHSTNLPSGFDRESCSWLRLEPVVEPSTGFYR